MSSQSGQSLLETGEVNASPINDRSRILSWQVPLELSRQMKLLRPFLSRGPFQFKQLPQALAVMLKGIKVTERGRVDLNGSMDSMLHLKSSVENPATI
jgi:hypothetical protein